MTDVTATAPSPSPAPPAAPPDLVAGAPAPSRLRRFLAPWSEVRTPKELLHLLLNFPIGVITFTGLVVLVSIGASTAILLTGLPLLVLTGILVRGVANFERGRACLLLGATDLVRPVWPGAGSPWWRRIWPSVKDPTVWKEALYELVLFPWGIATFTVAVVVVSIGLSMPLLPLYGWALPSDAVQGGWLTIASYTVIGFAVLLVGPWVVRGIATLDRALARALLGVSARELNVRIEHLSDTRARTVDAATAERQRIERALHDGAQIRLTALAMELGRAKEKMATDPDGAAALVDAAHDEAKRALVELRDLARGIHPAILTDRGLDAALSAIAARAPVPVDVAVDLPDRPPAAVEATAYYVVAEALNNVARHAGATRASVVVREEGRSVVVEVQDDGRGGAVIAPPGGMVPTGLRGLADRVAGVDGALVVSSPAGGPTVLRAELPCGS
jgi:signal transduction histidine kinase